MQYFFEEATGLTLTARKYSSSSSITEKCIVVGIEPAIDNNMSFDGIGNNGAYSIATDNMAIYIYAKSDMGIVNGVYAFLNELFNLEIFYYDEYSIEQTTADIVLTPLSIVGSPEFEYSFAGYGELKYNINASYGKAYANRMGFTVDYEVSKGGIHNSLIMISESEYGGSGTVAQHPEWFYTGTTSDGYNTGTQLIYAAENFATNEGSLVYTVAQKLWANIEAFPDAEIFGFSPMDIDIWANTGKSAELYSKYGTHAAEYIIFMNAVAGLLDAKMTLSVNSDRVIKLELLAYNKTLCAPDTTGLTTAEIEAIVLYKGTKVKCVPFVAPVESNYYLAFTDENNKVKNPLTGVIDQNSSTVAEVILRWSQLADEIYLWQYSLDASNYFMPMDTLSNMAVNYKFSADNKVSLMYNQSQYDTEISTDWSRLKIYLQSALAKDKNADTDALTEEFMQAYFKSGAEKMKTLLSEEKAWYAVVYDKQNKTGTLRGSEFTTGTTNKAWWDDTPTGILGKTYDSSMLIRWMGYIDQAKSTVNADETLTNEEKTKICTRIDIEGLTIRYLLLNVFLDTTYDTDMPSFYAAANAIGITKTQE